MRKSDIEMKIMEINGDLRELKGQVNTLGKLQIAELSLIVAMFGTLLIFLT